jgi:hypothetical protein
LVQLAVHLAITAAEEKLQDLLGQVLDMILWGIEDLQIRQPAVIDDCAISKRDEA